jgi:hypothetical protein
MAPLLAPAQAESSGAAAQTCERLLTELSESNRAIFHKHPSLRDKVPTCPPSSWSQVPCNVSWTARKAYCATCARPRCTDSTCGVGIGAHAAVGGGFRGAPRAAGCGTVAPGHGGQLETCLRNGRFPQPVNFGDITVAQMTSARPCGAGRAANDASAEAACAGPAHLLLEAHARHHVRAAPAVDGHGGAHIRHIIPSRQPANSCKAGALLWFWCWESS